MLDKKLQIKPGQTIALVDCPITLDTAAQQTPVKTADAVLFFVKNQPELNQTITDISEAAARDALVWLAYPKAKLLGTDLNRDIVREYAATHQLDTVRQIALDDTWSALRLKRL